MVGTLKNSQVNAPVIVDAGSTENSFKAVTTMRGSRTSNVHVLIIQEFIKDNKKSVEQFLSDTEDGLSVKAFKRVALK